jgi:5-bromo-4-chloroindolyl phosphate hydrolysis protein
MAKSLSIEKHISYISDQIESLRDQLETTQVSHDDTQFIRGQIFQCRNQIAALEKMLKEPSTTEAAFMSRQ